MCIHVTLYLAQADDSNNIFRMKDFGDIDDARYLHSEKIYENENLPDEENELGTKSSAALQASRTCSIWVEYVLILLNIMLSSAVNYNDVAKM